MQLVIFGASGKVGRLAVGEALARGHTVRAFVHHNGRLAPRSGLAFGLTIVQGDIHRAADVVRALQGAQAVISALGSWGSKQKDILSSGMRLIIPAMEQAGMGRIVSLTGAEARDAADAPMPWRLVTHRLGSAVAGKILADGEEHIRLLRASRLDWTVLRSPVMTNGAAIFYKLSLQPPKPWQTIPRKAVAKALVDQIEGPGYSGAAPFICRR